MIHFYQACRPSSGTITCADIARKPLLHAFLNRLDLLLDTGRGPNASPLQLTGLVLEGLFVEDRPDLEIWHRDTCVYQSSRADPGHLSWDYDNASAMFKVDQNLPEDFAIICRLGKPDDEDAVDASGADDENDYTVFRLVCHAGFLMNGPNEVEFDDVAVSPGDEEYFDEESFHLTMFLKRRDRTTSSAVQDLVVLRDKAAAVQVRSTSAALVHSP